jgi:hypothetical protein
MLIYSTPPVFSARFEVPDEDNYDGPYQVGTPLWGHPCVLLEFCSRYFQVLQSMCHLLGPCGMVGCQII